MPHDRPDILAFMPKILAKFH